MTYSDEPLTQVTFHYDNGQEDSFLIPVAPEEFQKQLPLLLERPWLTFHLIDASVVVAMNKVVKVETQPPLTTFGVGVFANAERVTPLVRGSR